MTEKEEAYQVVVQLRDALAGAMRVLAQHGHADEFVDEMRRLGVEDGLGKRVAAWMEANRTTKWFCIECREAIPNADLARVAGGPLFCHGKERCGPVLEMPEDGVEQEMHHDTKIR